VGAPGRQRPGATRPPTEPPSVARLVDAAHAGRLLRWLLRPESDADLEVTLSVADRVVTFPVPSQRGRLPQEVEHYFDAAVDAARLATEFQIDPAERVAAANLMANQDRVRTFLQVYAAQHASITCSVELEDITALSSFITFMAVPVGEHVVAAVVGLSGKPGEGGDGEIVLEGKPEVVGRWTWPAKDWPNAPVSGWWDEVVTALESRGVRQVIGKPPERPGFAK
jgi:hypothetical protein